MRFQTAALASAFFVAGVTAQFYPTVNPEDIDENQRAQWCLVQESSCPNICRDTGFEALQNICDYETLSYSCVCENQKEPDLDVYSQTVPYFICTYQVQECVNNCGGVSNCVSKCRENKPCGARDPPKANNTATETPTSASETTSTNKPKFTGGFGTDGEVEDDGEESAGVRSFGSQTALGFAIMGLGAAATLFL